VLRSWIFPDVYIEFELFRHNNCLVNGHHVLWTIILIKSIFNALNFLQLLQFEGLNAILRYWFHILPYLEVW
jgi:hypothetical protein